jgi:hypothetical protein
VRAHRIFVITALVVASIAIATTAVASAAAGRSTSAVNAVVMGQSLRAQLAGARVYQFAISVDGELEVTGEKSDPSPLAAVAALRNGAPSGDAVSCHARFGSVEAVLLVNAGASDTQPCGVLGLAYEAAR